MRRAVFVGFLGLLCCTSNAHAEPFLLVVKSATIAKTKADGSAWDLGVGKKTWPDPFVRIWVYDGDGSLTDSGESAILWDTFTPVWNQELATVNVGFKVKLEVWDKDLKYDDLIGKHEFKLTEADLKQEELSLKFGQVEKLTLALRRARKAAGEPRLLVQQPHPGPRSAKQLQRSEDCERAVILVHGLDLRDDGSALHEPRIHGWQGSTSPLVRALAKHGDVFAISYRQTVTVEEIATFPELREVVQRIKGLGYKEIVLVGHSAGGLLARHFIEDYPNTGVTRVIQVACPNAGAHLADWGFKLGLVRREQEAFVKSLGPPHRTALLKSRQERLIPAGTEFVTVVSASASGIKGDSVVSRLSQWPKDLQDQCIPCVRVQTSHLEAMVHDNCLKVLCTLVSEPQPRWSEARVREMRQEMGLAAK